MQKIEKDFKDWKLALKFIHGDEPKSWITKDNFTDHIKGDWDEIMTALWIIEKLSAVSVEEHSFYWSISSVCVSIYSRNLSGAITELISVDNEDNAKEASYEAIIKFIEWYNESI